MKVVQKDGDRFPELVAEVRERIITRGHLGPGWRCRTLFGDVTRRAADGGGASVASLADGLDRIEEAMFGPRPVGEDDFLEAWLLGWSVWVYDSYAGYVTTGVSV